MLDRTENIHDLKNNFLMDDLLSKQTKFYYVRAWTVVKGEKTAGQRCLLGRGPAHSSPGWGLTLTAYSAPVALCTHRLHTE